MNLTVGLELVARLRSGEINQCFNTLCNTDGDRCVLGVMCDIVKPEGWSKYEDASAGIPHTQIRDLAGVSILECFDLAQANDSGKDFLELADMVQRNLDRQAPEEARS